MTVKSDSPCVATNSPSLPDHTTLAALALVATTTLVLCVASAAACGSNSNTSGTPSSGNATGDAGGLAETGGAFSEGGESLSDAAASIADAGAPSPEAARIEGGTCDGALICDDFESYPNGGVPTSPWAVAKTAGAVTVDTTRAHSGVQSVKVSAPASSGYQSAMLRFANHGLPIASNVVFGRMMFWLDSAPATQVHWTFIDGSGLVPGASYHAVERYGGQVPLTAADGGFLGSELMASYDTPDSYNRVGPGSDCYRHSRARAVPVGVWTCAEWEFDGPANTIRFWLDGQALDDLTVAATGDGCTQQPSSYVWTAPQFTQIDLGWETYQAEDARNIWLDDVAIGPQRVGCP
jgi:hypothetical protein